MKISGFDVTPLWPALGVSLSGVDLTSELSTSQTAALRELMRAHYLLVFPGQDLAPDDQMRVVSTFGPVVGPRDEGPLHSLVDVEAGDVVAFHSDYSFTPRPLPFISLYGATVEGNVANTAFLNGITACAELPPELRRRLLGRTVLHASDILHVGQRSAGSLRASSTRSQTRAFCGTHHPAILHHPDIGQEVLFINANLCVAINGLPEDEGEALLQDVFAHLYAPQRIHHYDWHAGDLLVFDNVALQHSRCAGPHRTLRRMVVSTAPLTALLSSTRRYVASPKGSPKHPVTPANGGRYTERSFQ
jgi:taurine dioxygenase